MSRVLSDLLLANEPFFSQMLQKIEGATGYPGFDIRLSLNINTNARQKISELGLDKKDTNGKELYYSLQTMIKLHDDFLTKALSGKNRLNAVNLQKKICEKVNSLDIPRSCWAIKQSSAKKLLKQTPPKHVMKLLGYRSVDSMIKHEQVAHLYCLMQYAESFQWKQRFIKSYKNLEPSDFEEKDVNVLLIEGKLLEIILGNFDIKQNIICLKELGYLFVIPDIQDHKQGIAITLLPLLIYNINEIRQVSSLLKHRQVKANFGSMIMSIANSDNHYYVSLAGTPIHWRTMYYYFGKSLNGHPEVFEPHVQPEDLSWKKAEEVLYKIEPALKFWEGNEYLAIAYDNRPVSFNLIDNAISYFNNLSYGQQVVNYVQENIWNELLARYLDKDILQKDILDQLDKASSSLIGGSVRGKFINSSTVKG